MRAPGLTESFAIVSLAVCLAGCCSPCKKKAGSGAGASGTSPAAAPPAGVTALGPGEDIPPARWSSPDESLAAVPRWMAGRRSYAPQLPIELASRWFEGASREPYPEADETLVVCRAAYDGTPDQGLKGLFNSSAPDLSVSVKVSGNVELHAAGPEDNHQMLLSVPLIARRSSAPLELSLIDRDGVGWDTLDTVTVPMPPKGEARKELSRATCHLIPRDEVEAQLSSASRDTDTSLEDAGRKLAVDLSSQMLGGLALHSKLEKATAPMASLVGWADPRVKRRLDWSDRILARHRQLCAELAAREAPARQRSAALHHHWVNWTLEVIGWECGAGVAKRFPPTRPTEQAPSGCVIVVRAAHDGDKRIGLPAFDRWVGGELVHADGEVTATWAVATIPAEGVDAGKTGLLVYAMAAKESPWEGVRERRPLLFILRPGLSEFAAVNVDGLGRWDGKAPAP